jgi:pimeloyl-ACP methyl ester carboxylesterase
MRLFTLPRWIQCLQVACMVLAASATSTSFRLLPQAHGKERPMRYPTFYRTIPIDGLSIFYREAGPKDAPTLLLLHGLPSSSRMFEPLFARLSDWYHLVAPDYPGFGHSDWPDPKKFAYTFDHYAEIMNHFAEALSLSCYTLYMQDYGGPVGFRMALAHPDRIEALIVQDCGAQRGPGGELEAAAGLLGRSRCQRKHTSHQSPVVANDAHAPCWKRSECGSL